MKKANEYEKYVGRTREQMMLEINDYSNYYLSNMWKWHINTNWLGKKKILCIFFKKDVVFKIRVKKTYGKVMNSKMYFI